MKTRRFAASLQAIREILLWVRLQAEQTGFTPPNQRKIELAIEEAVVNIILHAYQGKEGMIEISLYSDLCKQLKIILKDTGPHFNLLQQKKGQPPSSLEESREGGLGILFIQSMMDEVHYRRDQDKNILTLVKKIVSD